MGPVTVGPQRGQDWRHSTREIVGMVAERPADAIDTLTARLVMLQRIATLAQDRVVNRAQAGETFAKPACEIRRPLAAPPRAAATFSEPVGKVVEPEPTIGEDIGDERGNGKGPGVSQPAARFRCVLDAATEGGKP